MARELSSLMPRPTDRALFVGMTGSGKTTLGQLMLRARDYVVVYDGKGTLDWPGYTRVRTLERAVGLDPRKHPRILYQPTAAELRDEEMAEACFRWIYDRRNTVCYVDEIYSVAYGGQIPDSLHAILTRGRERRTPFLGATQRPMWIGDTFLTEAEHCYVFRLQAPQDRKKVSEFFGVSREQLDELPKHHFYYCAVGEDPVGPLTLRLKGDKHAS